MTFVINAMKDGETIHTASIWEPKEGKKPSWTLSFVDARLVRGGEGITFYGKLINAGGDTLFKTTIDKKSTYKKLDAGFSERVTFSVSNTAEGEFQRALRNILSALTWDTPTCLTVSLSTDAMLTAYASKEYYSAVDDTTTPITDEQLVKMAMSTKNGHLSLSPYDGPSLFEDNELVSRKGDPVYQKGKTPLEAMDERITCLDNLAARFYPDEKAIDLMGDEGFYRYASLVIR